MVFLYSYYQKSQNRNKIVFEDEFKDVQDSLVSMKKFLNQLPKRSDRLNVNYIIKNKALYVNEVEVKLGTSTPNALKGISISEQNNFIGLTKYLYKNHISSAYFDQRKKIWRFIYNESSDASFNDVRDIVLVDSGVTEFISSLDTILERKEKLYLLAPVGAKTN